MTLPRAHINTACVRLPYVCLMFPVTMFFQATDRVQYIALELTLFRLFDLLSWILHSPHPGKIAVICS